MKIDKNDKIPAVNYFKLFCVIVITISLALILRNWYISSVNYELEHSIIKEVLISEINQDEIYHYVRENEDAIIYLGVVSNSNCREFEKEFKDVVVSRGFEDIITYLNITSSKNKSKFIKEFNKFYDTNVLGYPSFIIFEDGKVKDILTVKTGRELTTEEVINFLNKNKVGSDNL